MKKDVMKKWVRALRSGKYKQGQNYLKFFNKKNEPQHCCLGVLCELYNQDMKKKHKKLLKTEIMTDDIDAPKGYVRFDTSAGELPEKVMKWAEIHSEDGTFEFDHPSLVDLNDGGKRFSTIANTIEKNYEFL